MQEVILGVDSVSKMVGFSASFNTGKLILEIFAAVAKQCQSCGAHTVRGKEVKFHIHHLESRKIGGNAPDNLITVCDNCHQAIHNG